MKIVKKSDYVFETHPGASVNSKGNTVTAECYLRTVHGIILKYQKPNNRTDKEKIKGPANF